MDTNNDGIIDDPLATKKVGRKPLDLTEEEWRVRRNEQRKQRENNKAVKERYQAIVTMGCDIIQAYEEYEQECARLSISGEKDRIDYVNERLRDFYMELAKDEYTVVRPLPKFRS